jgi:hypothetical protein
MACLLLTPDNVVKNDFHEVSTKLSPEKLELLERRQLVVQLSNDIPPFFKRDKVISPEPYTKINGNKELSHERPAKKPKTTEPKG